MRLLLASLLLLSLTTSCAHMRKCGCNKDSQQCEMKKKDCSKCNSKKTEEKKS